MEGKEGESLSIPGSVLFRVRVSKVHSDAYYPEPAGSGLYRILARKDQSFRPGMLSEIAPGLRFWPCQGTALEFLGCEGNVRRGIVMPSGIQLITEPGSELRVLLRQERNKRAPIRRGETVCLMRAVPNLGIYMTAPD